MGRVSLRIFLVCITLLVFASWWGLRHRQYFIDSPASSVSILAGKSPLSFPDYECVIQLDNGLARIIAISLVREQRYANRSRIPKWGSFKRNINDQEYLHIPINCPLPGPEKVLVLYGTDGRYEGFKEVELTRLPGLRDGFSVNFDRLFALVKER